ncbi:hypothetical protein TcYC6_0053020 [Trypanosoma cruzi]|nr:hypothetical protein TcBrA4_0104100 [Trypanosoma cruzi]KAF8301735.1 hypothetical protein TcYC6_0053020 [Trypanosoma cruzi]PBJ70463.1 hypothetical protein BCY84_18383 [Trypanosoma cruzi cruzi]
MAQDDTPTAGKTPKEKRQYSCNWVRIVLGVSAVAMVAFAWRSVYKANQRELHLRRTMEQNRQLLSALAEVPGKRFFVTDVNPEVLRKKALFG